MKKISRFTLIAVFVPALITSCITEKVMDDVIKAGKVVRLSAVIEDKPSTRVDDSGFCDGDSFGVFVVNYVDDNTPGELANKGNQADNVQFSYNETDNVWTTKKEVYYKDATTKVSIYGYYPYDSGISDVHAYPFSVMTDQRKAGAPDQMSGYEASDFLYGKVDNIVPTEQTVYVLFKHRMSSIYVSLVKGDGWESDNEWQATSKDILIGNTVINSSINLENGVVTPSGDVSQVGVVPKLLNDDSWKAVVVPQIVDAGKELVVVTVNGMVSSYSKDVEYTYYPGKMNTITLAVSKKSAAEGITLELVAESIVQWEDTELERESKDYIVVHCPEAGKLEETIIAEGYDLSSIKNLKVTGEINSPDFYVMKTRMDILEALNLADVKIMAFEKDENDWSEPYANMEDCIPMFAFQNKATLGSIILPNRLVKIGGYAFSGTNLTGSLFIPEGVVTIEASAFSEIQSLNGKVVFPTTLRVIEGYAFNNTSVRGELCFPNKLKRIGDHCFEGSSISGNLNLPDSLEYLGSQTFWQCKGLTGSLRIPDKIKTIPWGCFSYCGFGGELILNEDLESIDFYGFENCQFTGPLVLPKLLKQIDSWGLGGNRFSSLVIESTNVKIGESAFSMSITGGDLVFPEGIISIGQGAFSNCSIERICFPQSIENVGANAFNGCSYVSQIECMSENPPQIGAGAFDGVPKDNFIVEVPIGSIEDYQSASGWDEFKRIGAKRDFSISRRLYRTLNTKSEKVFTLRAAAGEVWSVQSKPEWVSVEPSSGTGKTEITVTVSQLPVGQGNRVGEIVYCIDDDGYTVSTSIEQFDYEHGDGDVIVNHRHTKGNGINLIFMGDGYDAKDISEEKYNENINEAIQHLFNIEPFKSYKDYFDVSIVIACSEDSGIQYASIIRDTKFKTTYTQGSGLETDESICDKYASRVTNQLSTECQIALICNTDKFTGKSQLYPGKRSISICPVVRNPYPYDFRGLVQHEIGGHGFGKLGDESVNYYDFIQSTGFYWSFLTAKSYGWYDNLSLNGDVKSAPWSHMIFDPEYSDVVDIYEGGYYCSRGVFRSEPNSCMNNYVPYFSSISRESIVRRIMEYAGEQFSYESFKEKDVKTAAKTNAPVIISNTNSNNK